MSKHTNKVLKINKSLPKIIINQDKIDLFIDWYNKDLRYQEEIPHTFEEGYLELHSNIFDTNMSKYNTFIKTVAKSTNSTFRTVENMLENFICYLNNITAYFYFKSQHSLCVYIYGIDNMLISTIEMAFEKGKGQCAPEVKLTKFGVENINIQSDKFTQDVQNEFNYFVTCLCISCLWYLATSTKTTKYKYNNSISNLPTNNKKVVEVSSVKTISNPIYNLNNIKIKSVDRLIHRREGFTYSHSFQVHGHFRHYKDGKVIFVNSFVKGKNKPFKQQDIIINPQKI